MLRQKLQPFWLSLVFLLILVCPAFAGESASDVLRAQVPDLIQSALRYAAAIPKAEDRARQMVRIYAAQAKSGDREGARETARLLLNTIEQVDDSYKRQELWYNAALSFSTSGDTDGALLIANRYESAGGRLNIRQGIFQRLAERGDIAMAIRLGDQCWATGMPYDLLIDIAMVQAKKSDAASVDATMRRVMALPNSGLDNASSSYMRYMANFATSFADRGDLTTARKYLKEAHRAQSRITSSGRSIEIRYDYDDLAIAEYACGEIDAARATASKGSETKRHNGWRKDLLLRQVRAGHVTEARQMAMRIEQPHWREQALQVIAVLQAEKGDLPAAIETIRESKSDVSRPVVLAAYAEYLARSGKRGECRMYIDLAYEAVNPEEVYWHRDEAVFAIAAAQIRYGDLSGARQTAGVATSAAIGGPLYARMANAYVRSASSGKASPVRRAKDACLAMVSLAQARGNVLDLEGAGKTLLLAYRMAQDIADPVEKDDAIRLIAESQAWMGDTAGALGTVEAIRVARLKDLALHEIATVRVLELLMPPSGILPALEQVNGKARRITDRIGDEMVRARTQAHLIDIYRAFGYVNGVSTLTDRIADPLSSAVASDVVGAAPNNKVDYRKMIRPFVERSLCDPRLIERHAVVLTTASDLADVAVTVMDGDRAGWPESIY